MSAGLWQMRGDYDWSEAEDIYNVLECLGAVKEVWDTGS